MAMGSILHIITMHLEKMQIFGCFCVHNITGICAKCAYSHVLYCNDCLVLASSSVKHLPLKVHCAQICMELHSYALHHTEFTSITQNTYFVSYHQHFLIFVQLYTLKKSAKYAGIQATGYIEPSAVSGKIVPLVNVNDAIPSNYLCTQVHSYVHEALHSACNLRSKVLLVWMVERYWKCI